MNERFGAGTASYVDVRDEFRADELDAWLTYFDEWDKAEKLRAAATEHNTVMDALAAATRQG